MYIYRNICLVPLYLRHFLLPPLNNRYDMIRGVSNYRIGAIGAIGSMSNYRIGTIATTLSALSAVK